jgi:hypothetical protein
MCKHQPDCFYGLLRSFEINHWNKGSVAGWMLSEMLAEMPDRIPLPEKEKLNK